MQMIIRGFCSAGDPACKHWPSAGLVKRTMQARAPALQMRLSHCAYFCKKLLPKIHLNNVDARRMEHRNQNVRFVHEDFKGF